VQFVEPLGLGMHRDHQLVFQAALNTLDCDRVLFFEDFPYATYYSKDELIEVDISECLEQRIAASEAYQSQIPTFFSMASSFRELIRAYTLEAGKQQHPIERYRRKPR
jgi:LmbE family N-acetylglucosaminyl deacetylase